MTDLPDPDLTERRPVLRVVGPDETPTDEPLPEPAADPGGIVDLMDRDGADDEGIEQAVDDEAGDQDWAWVAEWRESDEPPPWGTGVPLAAFAALLAGVAIWVLSAGLADRPVLAVVLNLLVAGGLVPAMWLCRNLPVLRWLAAGAAVGVLGGWVAALMML